MDTREAENETHLLRVAGKILLVERSKRRTTVVLSGDSAVMEWLLMP
jgi:hypothetical protein